MSNVKQFLESLGVIDSNYQCSGMVDHISILIELYESSKTKSINRYGMVHSLGCLFDTIETVDKLPENPRKNVFYIVGKCEVRIASVSHETFQVTSISLK